MQNEVLVDAIDAKVEKLFNNFAYTLPSNINKNESLGKKTKLLKNFLLICVFDYFIKLNSSCYEMSACYNAKYKLNVN